jgi:GNAT superfamily N-acetyltransferase
MPITIIFILFIILILIICFIICYCTFKQDNTNILQYGGTSETKLYFTISGEDNGLDFSQLRQLFKDASSKYNISFVEVPVSEKAHISFGTFKNDAVVKGETKRWNYDPLFFKQKTAIKNTLGEHHQLINKSELYDTIKKLIPNGIKYLPKCYNEKEIYNIDTIKYPLIVKKDNVPQQQAIQIVLSKEECIKSIKNLGIKTNKHGMGKEFDLMISEYITNPLLLNGKKFHLRIYFLLSVISGITRCSFYRYYRILTAKNPYIKSDWLNREIHLSGGHNTEQKYNFPEDLQKEYPDHFITIEKNLNACNKTICMAMTMANVKNYSESYSGYHLYGADIMLTDNYHPYLLEINNKPGFRFGEYGNISGWKEYNKQFSNQLFSFILHSTVFPLFGITRPPIYDAEFIGDGTLTPYANILTGHNKCFLIPYLDATSHEITEAKNIKFFNKSILFSNIIENCQYINIINMDSTIIGYLVLDNEHFIKIAIMEEFQNRGIATAIISQFLEFYYARNFTTEIKNIYIKNRNNFMVSIAKKLHFIKKNNIFVSNFLKKHAYTTTLANLTNKLLTYKIYYGGNALDINLVDILAIDKYIKQSNCQFVSFVYNLFDKGKELKQSTGSRYNKDYIYQGAELKSTLDIKILYSVLLFKIWAYSTLNISTFNFFLKRIENNTQLNSHSKYYIYDKNNLHYLPELLYAKGIKEEYYDINQYVVEEYQPPYLIDGKIMIIVFYIIIYMSKNGSIKYYIYPKNIIATPKDKYNENIYNLDENYAKYRYTEKHYNLDKILLDIKSSKSIIYEKIIHFFKILSQYDIKPYAESNSGFLEFSLTIRFVKNGDKYIPIINNTTNYCQIKKGYFMDDAFIKEYYLWVKNCVILPHFGIANHKNIIQPNYGKLSKYIQYSSKKIQYDIIEKIYLEYISNVEIAIYYNMQPRGSESLRNMQLQGNIKLHIVYNYIYIDQLHIKINDIEINDIEINDIEINIIFMLMELLRAYYAPIQMFLLLKYEKKMNDIAFELEFAKKDDYYIKKC